MGIFSAKEEKVFESKFIKPGIVENVKVEEFELQTNNSNGQEYIVVKLSQGDLTMEDNFSFSEKAKDWSIDKLSHMYNRFYDPKGWIEFSATANSLQEVVMFFNKNLRGKVFNKFKFSGKEIAGKDGKKNWFKATIGLPSFCSTEFSPKELKFDETNKYDMQRLVVADANPVSSNAEPVNDQLPF